MIIISLFHRIYEFKNLLKLWIMIHPWKKIIEEIRNRNWTQKQFAILVWKKNSEVNELIKWKRNITIQWDYVLSQVLWTPEKYWINMQTDYDYEQMKQKLKEEKNKTESFEIVEDIPSNNVQEASDVENKKEDIVKSWEEKNDVENSQNIAALPQNDQNELSQTNSESTWVESKESVDNKENSPSKSDNSSDKPQDNKEVEISEEEKQKRKEMKKIFINF